MSIRHLLDKTCTIERVSFTPVSGIEEITVSYSAIATNVPVRIDPAGTSSDDTEIGRIFSIAVSMYFASSVDIDHGDRVIVDGDTYEVLEVMNYSSLRRYFHKQVLATKKVDA